jgi:hypothetical protein
MRQLKALSATAVLAAMTGLAVAGEPLPKSGAFHITGGFKTVVSENIVLGDQHSYGTATAWGVVAGDGGPLHLVTAFCPHISETTADKIADTGKCAWVDAEGDKVLTEWSGEFLLKTGAGGGPQTITGGTGKFSGIQGSAPFKCQALSDKMQFTCTAEWTYKLSPAEASAK